MKTPKAYAVWNRNLRVWRRLFWASMLGNFGEPLIYLLSLGYGLGSLVGDLQGVPYIVFLSSGIVCSTAMNTAAFEGMYSAFTRMQIQRTWEAILTAPVRVRDIVLGESLWCATKSLISASCIMTVMWALGLVTHLQALWALPVVVLLGFCSGAFALLVTSFARSYDFFLYYFTLVVTPLMLLSGIFFPIERLPAGLASVVKVLPLYHAVSLIRPLLIGTTLPTSIGHHLGVLILYSTFAIMVASNRIYHRLIN